MANETLQTHGSVMDNSHPKKLRSGYIMTINDQVHVQAQWPQLNVYRTSSSLATYSTLSVEEFCKGYLTYIVDSLRGDKPNVDVALDYSGYLHELLDEAPLQGWEVVREAHGEILRQIEQCRLKWEDVVARNKAKNCKLMIRDQRK